MKKQPSDQDYVEMSDQTYQKSFHAFKQGLAEAPSRKNKPYLLASLSLAGAAIAATLLFASTMDAPTPNGQGDAPYILEDEKQDENVELELPEGLKDIEVNIQLARQFIKRGPYVFSPTQPELLHHDEFFVSLSTDWNVESFDIKNGTKAVLSGPDSEEVTIILFDNNSPEEIITQEANKLLDEHPYTVSTKLPYEDLRNHFINARVVLSHDRVGFTIDKDAWLYSFENDQTKRFYDLFSSKLYGKRILLFANYPLDQPDKWAQTYYFMSNIFPEESPYVLEVSDELSEDGRPLEKEVVTSIDFEGYTRLEVELYHNKELQFSTYLPKNAKVDRIAHREFTEWKITSDSESNSFYSFAKLDSDINVDELKEILVHTYGIDSRSIEVHDDESISFYTETLDGKQTNEMTGYIKKYTFNKESYFIYQQIDTSIEFESAQVLFTQMPDYFIEELEWE
ncbi:hypothetical protein ACTHQ4_13695 [Alkalicoccobacillus gibsonii]|uniref:hypothetical protein n=1 Tax=Alkalicoccobacillus gibsonii TaxID=79881 RepID=UPI003F7CCE8E